MTGLNEDQYQCAMCKEIFTKPNDENWNEELARKEFEEKFPYSKWDKKTMEVICNDCWQIVKPD